MPTSRPRLTIVMADDDDDDVFLSQSALAAAEARCEFHAVPDGAALLELLRDGTGGNGFARPDLILLDLNMPRMDGHTALRALKADPELCRIPVVVLTTSNMRSDIVASYSSGAASYVCKPVTFDALVDLFRTLHHWWGDLVELPAE